MKRLQIVAWVSIWILLLGLTMSYGSTPTSKTKRRAIPTVVKSVKITACKPDPDRVSLSHDPNKGERLHWTASQGRYVVMFKDLNSPCHKSAAAGSSRLFTFEVPSGRSPHSDACFARADTRIAEYPYVIYQSAADGTLTPCADPVVIVTDGRP